MKRYIIVGWDEKEKKMKYLGSNLHFQEDLGLAQIFDNTCRFGPVVIPGYIERVFKIQVNFGKVEKVK